jgi:Cu(I)/Ag(I) efflux system membrane fusion protein
MPAEPEARPAGAASPDVRPGAPLFAEGEEPVPRGVKTMAVVRWIILAASALLAVAMWWSYASARLDPSASGASAVAKYHCPMHPQITSSEPGECPICHMTLEPISVRQPPPLPREGDDRPSGSALPPGTAPITLTLDRMQAIGVRTAPVTEGGESQPLRVSAVVAPSEQGRADVHVRTPGFVERLLVDETGVRVTPGEPLLTFYSPEIYQAESELLAVAQWAGSDPRAGAADAARRKLELLGMAPRDIDRLVKTRELLRAVPIYAPQAGYVVKKNVVVGGYVTPEMTLYELQDLSRVYVFADVFQRDAPSLPKGTRGRFTATARSDQATDVRIDLVYPIVDAEARTTRVRMQIDNPSHVALRPGQYGSVEFATAAKKTLTVPRDAVVDTGLATYVFVVRGEGTFSPRAVVLGREEGELVAVESGLSLGDRVVSGATFLIDSESRLQAAALYAAAKPRP